MASPLKKISFLSPKYVSVGHAPEGRGAAEPVGALIRFITFSCAKSAAPSVASEMLPATLPPVMVAPAARSFSFHPDHNGGNEKLRAAGATITGGNVAGNISDRSEEHTSELQSLRHLV